MLSDLRHDEIVLNVDDTEHRLYIKQRILKHAGIHVENATSGAGALEAVERLRPALVLLDVNLPDISGLEVCRIIKARAEYDRPLVCHISAMNVDSTDRVRGLDLGADAYLVEPVDPRELVATVRALLRSRRAESAARESEERLSFALQAADMVAWEWDPQSDQIIRSPNARSLLGLEVAGAMRDFLDRLHGDDRERVQHALQHAVQSGADYAVEYRLLMPDGSTRWLSDRGHVAAHPASGSPGRRFRGVAYDMTARRRLEMELKQRMEELAEADRRKNAFLAVLGHELRNPLQPIRNAVQVLKLIGGGDAESHEMRNIIDRQVAHMSRMIDDLLDVSRITSGKILLRKMAVDIVDLLRHATDDFRNIARAQGIRLEVDLPSQPLGLLIDPTRVAQAVGNLLQNSVKFTNDGGTIWLSLVHLPEQRCVEIRVRDTGIGMNPQTIRMIFTPFSQADTSLDRSRGGLGLGLSLVRGLIEMHGGSVRANSEGLDCGAEFIIRLPLPPEPLPVGETAAQPASAPEPMRILVVDDRRDAYHTMRVMLQRMGHVVAVAEDGEGALQKARTFHPQIVLCDIGLPEPMSGYDVARAMRADENLKHAYLVAVTGYGQDEDRTLAQNAGFDMHITKPVSQSALESLLAQESARQV